MFCTCIKRKITSISIVVKGIPQWKSYLQVALSTALMAVIYPSYAGISFGNTDDEYGKLTVSGYVRANYQDKHYGESASDQKFVLMLRS